MMPVIVALPFRNITRKLPTTKILIEYLIDLCFRVYPPPCCIELPTFRIFASGGRSSGFRFGSFFLWFRRIFLPFGGFFFRLWRNNLPGRSSGFRFHRNFRKPPSAFYKNPGCLDQCRNDRGRWPTSRKFRLYFRLYHLLRMYIRSRMHMPLRVLMHRFHRYRTYWHDWNIISSRLFRFRGASFRPLGWLRFQFVGR